MARETEISDTASLEQQVLQISGLAAEIGQVLRSSRGSLPQKVVDGLSQLGASLTRLGRQISHKEEERKNLMALADIGGVINSSLNPNEVLRIVMDTIVRLSGAERGFLMLKDPNGELSIRVARNWEQETLNRSEYAISRTVVNRVVTESQAVLTTNAQEDPRFGGQESIVVHNLRSILCVPLIVKDELIGVIYADNRAKTGIFATAELDLLTAFANQAAVAIENARLFESLRLTLAEVTELKNLMDNIFSSIVSGVITADVQDKILLSNRAAQTILGRDSSDILGRSLKEVLPKGLSELEAQINIVRRTDQPVIGLEINPTLPQRGAVDLRFNLSPLKDAEQKTQGVAIVLDDLTEQKRLEAQRQLFEKMVSPAVIDQIDPNELSLGGKRVSITTLFADMRGYTTFSESLDPEHLVSVLNRYLAGWADAVLAQEGTIDKFLGDAIMAWFNAPMPQADHALRAVRAALEIRETVYRLHKELPQEVRLSFGVGIHYGDAVLGLVGTERRLDYTAIGDSVNTAKRIQENATAGQILMSEAAYEQTGKRLVVKEVEPVVAKGKSKPIRVYEVIGVR